MPVYECLTHGIKRKIEPEINVIEIKTGFVGAPKCYLLVTKNPTEGRFGPCIIKRVA